MRYLCTFEVPMRVKHAVPLVAALAALAARSASATPTDYSHLERCVSPTGANATYAKWIGSVESSLSFITQTQVNLALEVGKDRTAPGARSVNIFKLRRVGDSGLLEAVPAERDDFFPDVLDLVMSSEVDSYLIEFAPTQPAGPKEGCVLAFGNLWAWAARPGGALPFALKRESFTVDKLNMTVVKQALYRGQDGLPQTLRLEALKDGAPALLPVALLDTDPGTRVDWDGKSNSIRNPSNSHRYNLWLCSSGPALSSRPACLGLIQYQLNDDPLVIRSRSEIGLLKQTASIQGLENGQLTTYSLVGTPAGTSSRTFEYGGGPQSPMLPPGVKDNFVTTERDLEYVVVLVGSADSERLGRRCPTDVSQPMSQLRIYSGGSSSAFDVNACLYLRDSNNRAWQLVPDAPEGDAPEQRLLDAMQFALCPTSTTCTAAGFLGARTQMGFRVSGRTALLTLQASSVHDSPMPLDPATAALLTIKAVYLPRLPSASVAETEVPHIDFRTFDRSEWDSQKTAVCIEGDWKKQYGADVMDAGASLLLRGGAKQTSIGDGRWKVATVNQKELLCPELTDAQVQQLLTAVREGVLTGQVSELDAIQGGQLVGRHVMLRGPDRVPISGIELHTTMVDGAAVLETFSHRGALPPLGSICLMTESDWGDLVYLDPSRLAMRSDRGDTISTFRSLGPDPGRHAFGRPENAPKTFDGKKFRYCAPVSQGEAKPMPNDIEVTAANNPGLQTHEISLTIEDSQGCVGSGGAGRQPCARLLADTVVATTGGTAIGAFHVGLSYGREFSLGSGVPATELRGFLALPLALFEVHPPGPFSIAMDTGVDVGVAAGQDVINGSFTTRASVPIGGYGALCISVTGLKRFIHTSPRVCGGAFVDLIAIKSSSSTEAPTGKLGVDPPAFVPFVSLGLGEF